jgi:hypothetical protein
MINGILTDIMIVLETQVRKQMILLDNNKHKWNPKTGAILNKIDNKSPTKNC